MRRNRKISFSTLIQKIDIRFSRWASINLPEARRFVMIRNVTYAILVHHMTSFKLPDSTIAKMKSRQQMFRRNKKNNKGRENARKVSDRKNAECSDEDPGAKWIEVKMKNKVKSIVLDEVALEGKQTCKVEAKTFSFEKGAGSKEGFFLIKEVKGDNNFVSLWVSSKGLLWIYTTISNLLLKEWSAKEHWDHMLPGEWLMSSRGKNKNGQYF